jgi:oxalate decarboxylase/phosphoglucose isomerase-like protein (cupin superfamily)
MKTRFMSVLFLPAIMMFAQVPAAVEITAEPGHHLALQNAYVRAFQVEVPPHGATLLHHHGHDYIGVILGASQVENDVEGKPPVTLKFNDGDTFFTPGNFSHIAKNLTDTPFRNVTVEFMQDEAAHKNPPAKWDEERGVDVYDGGTRDILFVKDGVRVSEINLQPGAMIPSHRHKGPHLLIPVSDLDLRSDIPGKPNKVTHSKAGAVEWIPGGYTHTLMNAGKAPAKFVTVEFQ